MHISDNGLDLIKRFEGFRSAPYLDPVGIPTIGYGATAIHPYLALETVSALAASGRTGCDPAKAAEHYIKAVDKGLLKVMSNLVEPQGRRIDDRAIAALTRLTPSA